MDTAAAYVVLSRATCLDGIYLLFLITLYDPAWPRNDDIVAFIGYFERFEQSTLNRGPVHVHACHSIPAPGRRQRRRPTAMAAASEAKANSATWHRCNPTLAPPNAQQRQLTVSSILLQQWHLQRKMPNRCLIRRSVPPPGKLSSLLSNFCARPRPTGLLYKSMYWLG